MSNRLDRLALIIGLGGLIAAVLIGVLGRLIHRPVDGLAYLMFIGTQIAAIVVGLVARKEPAGRAAAITSSILLVASLAVVA